MSFFRAHSLWFLLTLVSLAPAFVPTEDGIYAVFNTSEGVFVADLFYEDVPLAVANFVGLASGTKTYFNRSNGEISNAPFYDGITFHRVVTDFVIQAGSPDGTGTDGPGYTFEDEFLENITHDAEGILSMANAGPATNGSQFFVTLRATPELDGLHSVFGRIYDGIEVVSAIGAVGRNPQEANPAEAVVIESVEIVRAGAAAEAWDETSPALPLVYGESLEITFLGDGTPLLNLDRPAYTQAWLFISEDLLNWGRLAAWNFSLVDQPDFTAAWDPVGFDDQVIRFLRRVDVLYPE